MKQRKTRLKDKKFEKLVLGLKRHPKQVDNLWALAHSIQKKQIEKMRINIADARRYLATAEPRLKRLIRKK